MPYRLFSQRQAEREGKKAIPVMKTFPSNLRRRILTTISEAIGMFYDRYVAVGNEPVATTDIWKEFERVLYKRSDAYASLSFGRNDAIDNRIRTYMMGATDGDFLDALDLAIVLISVRSPAVARQGEDYRRYCQVELMPEQALSEIDTWLREAGSVYRVGDKSIIETSDDFTHDNVVLPALQRLRNPAFANAAREFDQALQAYRDGRFPDVLTKVNHAFESTMKVIAGKMKWAYEPTSTAKQLIAVMIGNGLIPPMRESAMNGLRMVLESDVPTLRNKTPSAGHGAGEASDVQVPDFVAAFAIQPCAASINLLIDAYNKKMKEV